MAKASLGKAESRYRELETDRNPFLDRARECSKYTLPSLIPPDGHNGSTKLRTPFQGIGARGTNNLASKLLITLLPPNSPFFRYQIDESTYEEEVDADLQTEVEQALAKMERVVMSDIETSADRVAVFEALKHLIVGGNVLLFDDENGLRVFHLDRFVCRRDPMGSPIEIVVHETVSPDALPEDFYKNIKRKLKKNDTGKRGSDKTLSLYTHIKREQDKWTVYQECVGEKVPESDGTYPLDACPWIPLRINRIEGEDYGRSYVEEYLGDLKSLEALMQAIVEGSAAAAKLLILVDPNGTTRAKTIENAPNGAVREGNADDVSILQMDKFADFRIAYQTIEMLTERLSFAFLLNTSIQRNAERVTAEEVRYMAGELEDALGGIYSILSQEFQLPYVNRKMVKLQKQGALPALPKDIVKPSIITGLEALGRGHDRNKLVNFITTLGQTLGPEVIQQYVHVDDAIARLALSDGIETDGLIKTKEEIAQSQQQAQMQAMMHQLGPDAIQAFSQMASSGAIPNPTANQSGAKPTGE
ncbi:portal protein [Desulfovibrio oxyclinae]|uniref:portal protein n=1 Tax=Desulfovibrio oxyclinae TaxID=63560 RepID=UPI000362700A|nr:portal protein [Desulfovibrio oxyclinae]